MSKPQVLIIEDDAAIRQGIADALQYEGYSTREAKDGHEGLEMALGKDYDLLLLDLVLPGPGGLEILREVRAARPTTPVIILTAKGDESDRVRGLRLGADDYVVKPFSVRELLARVEAVLRRSPERPSDISKVKLPDGEADLARRQVSFGDGTRRELSEHEVELLRHLARYPGRAVSRDELLSRVWHVNPNRVETRTVDMHIARLREKLGDDPSDPKIILTVRGVGYMLGESVKPE